MRTGQNPNSPILDWQEMQSYGNGDVYCTNNHSTKMQVMPNNPYKQFTHFYCLKCKGQIDIDNICNTFQVVQQALEQEFQISTLFYNGILLIESLEFSGDSRNKMRPKLLGIETINNIKQLFKTQMEKLLQVRILELRDLFQN